MSEDVVKRADGTEKSRSGIVNSNIGFYQEKYEENITNICDFSDGSEIRTLHESIAVDIINLYRDNYELFKQTFVLYATGAYLDWHGCEYHLSRKQSDVATGNVTFSLKETLAVDYIIPQGTVILGRGTGYEYILSSNITIPAGTLTTDGTVYSKLTGARYNSLANTLTAFKDEASIRKPVSVTNANPITGGVDAETDDEFRQRILAAKKESAYGTVSSYINLLKNSVNDIHDVSFVDPELLINSVYAAKHYKTNGKDYCTDCDAVVFVNANSKPCPDNVLDEVNYIMTQQNNIVIGQLFHVQKAALAVIYLYVNVYVETIVNEDVMADHIQAYLDGDEITTKSGNRRYKGLDIGEILYKSKLIDCIENIPGVLQVESIHRLNYNKNIPTEQNKWVANGDENKSYTYIDGGGYTYTWDVDSDTPNYWGRKNFDKIVPGYGKVISLGQMKDVDSSTTAVISLKQIIQ